MSNIISQSLIDKLWLEYQQDQNAAKIASKYRISEKTVRRYRKMCNWDERLLKINQNAQKLIDQNSAKRVAENLMLLQGAKKVYAAGLLGMARTSCPNCGAEVSVPVPRHKAALADIEKLVRCEDAILGMNKQNNKQTASDSDERLENNE